MNQTNYSVEELVSHPGFRKWTRGELDEEQAGKWDRWIQQSNNNRKKAKRAQEKILNISFRSSDHPNVEEEWNAVRRRIMKKGHLNRKIVNRKRQDGQKWKIAAAAVVLIALAFAIFQMKFDVPPSENVVKKEAKVEELATSFGEMKTVQLSDGSKIVLAANSKITYRDNWLEKSTQQLKLVRGEAFFSVMEKNSTNGEKFVVQTDDGKVTVVGTEFTVSTYGEGTQVVLQEGKINVAIAGTTWENSQRVMLEAGELARFQKSSKRIKMEKVDPRVYTSWTSQKLYFDETPLSMLIDRLERTYNVSVSVKDPKLYDKKLSGTVEFRDLESLMKSVSTVLELNMVRNGDKVVISSKSDL